MVKTAKQLKLTSEDIIDIPIETYLGKEYGNAILATMETKKGFYDVLFTEQGEAFNRLANESEFEAIQEYYNKTFEPGDLNGNTIWAQKIEAKPF